jgi:hypothetical protein
MNLVNVPKVGTIKLGKKEEKEEIEEIKVTVLKHEEVARVQELERQNRKPTWAKIVKKRKLSIQLS